MNYLCALHNRTSLELEKFIIKSLRVYIRSPSTTHTRFKLYTLSTLLYTHNMQSLILIPTLEVHYYQFEYSFIINQIYHQFLLKHMPSLLLIIYLHYSISILSHFCFFWDCAYSKKYIQVKVNSYLEVMKLNDRLLLSTMRNEVSIEKENRCSHIVEVTSRLSNHDVAKFKLFVHSPLI